MTPKVDAFVMLPALLCDSRLYQPLSGAMKSRCQKLVPNLSALASIPDMAKGLLKDLPKRFALMGTSMGGYLALEIIRQGPERVSHLFLVGTNADADSPELQEKRMQAIRLAESGKMDAFVDTYASSALHDSNKGTLGPLMTDMARQMGPAALIAQQRAIMSRKSASDVLLTLSVPTAVVCGESDAFSTPEQHAAMAMSIRTSTYHEIDNCGHMVPLEAPGKLAAIVDELLNS